MSISWGVKTFGPQLVHWLIGSCQSPSATKQGKMCVRTFVYVCILLLQHCLYLASLTLVPVFSFLLRLLDSNDFRQFFPYRIYTYFLHFQCIQNFPCIWWISIFVFLKYVLETLSNANLRGTNIYIYIELYILVYIKYEFEYSKYIFLDYYYILLNYIYNNIYLYNIYKLYIMYIFKIYI